MFKSITYDIHVFQLHARSVEYPTDAIEYTTEVRQLAFKRRILHVPNVIHKLCLIIFYP